MYVTALRGSRCVKQFSYCYSNNNVHRVQNKICEYAKIGISYCLYYNLVIYIFPVEANVRTELMEQVPHIAMYCHENQRPTSFDPIPAFLLPIVVKYLTDSNNQVITIAIVLFIVVISNYLIITIVS